MLATLAALWGITSATSLGLFVPTVHMGELVFLLCHCMGSMTLVFLCLYLYVYPLASTALQDSSVPFVVPLRSTTHSTPESREGVSRTVDGQTVLTTSLLCRVIFL